MPTCVTNAAQNIAAGKAVCCERHGKHNSIAGGSAAKHISCAAGLMCRPCPVYLYYVYIKCYKIVTLPVMVEWKDNANSALYHKFSDT